MEVALEVAWAARVAWAAGVSGVASATDSQRTLCSFLSALPRAGRYVQLRLTAPPAQTVRRLQGASAEPDLFNGEWEGLDRGGEGEGRGVSEWSAGVGGGREK